jgi:hypothetical protein
MSWQKSQYSENPFSDNAVETNFDARAPLNKSYVPPTAAAAPPPWLQEPSTSSSNNQNSSNDGAPATIDPATLDPAIPRMITFTRITNLVLSVCMILTSLLALLTTQSATTGVLACYVVVFSCLLCCFETHLKQISKFIALNFGFMYSAKSRSVFMMFVGTILFSFSLFGKIIGLCMIANAFFNFFILFRYPQYEDAQRSNAESEIKDFLASNPAFSQRLFEGGFKMGADLFRSNPDLARQGAQAMFTGSVSSNASAQQSPASDGSVRGNYVSV